MSENHLTNETFLKVYGEHIHHIKEFSDTLEVDPTYLEIPQVYNAVKMLAEIYNNFTTKELQPKELQQSTKLRETATKNEETTENDDEDEDDEEAPPDTLFEHDSAASFKMLLDNASIALSKHQYGDVIKHTTDAMEINPNSVRAMRLKSQAHWCLDHFEDAYLLMCEAQRIDYNDEYDIQMSEMKKAYMDSKQKLKTEKQKRTTNTTNTGNNSSNTNKMPSNMPNMSNMPDMGNIQDMMNNPAMMQMAENLMKNPQAMQNIMNMFQGGLKK